MNHFDSFKGAQGKHATDRHAKKNTMPETCQEVNHDPSHRDVRYQYTICESRFPMKCHLCWVRYAIQYLRRC